MKRKQLLKQLGSIAESKGVEMTIEEGAKHTKIRYNGKSVTIVARHREVPEITARGALRDAKNWEEQ